MKQFDWDAVPTQSHKWLMLKTPDHFFFPLPQKEEKMGWNGGGGGLMMYPWVNRHTTLFSIKQVGTHVRELIWMQLCVLLCC